MDISFFNEETQERVTEKIIIDLFDDIAPKTVHNFYSFIKETEIGDEEYGYKGNKFHRIIKGFMIQGGDIVNGNGTGSISVYNGKFDDENFIKKHNKGGMLSMANSGEDTNGCQFFITEQEAPWLDGKHVVFGEVTEETFKHILAIGNVAVGNFDEPKHDVEIVECGDHLEKETKEL